MKPLVVESLSDTESRDVTSGVGSGKSRCTGEERLIVANMKSCHIASPLFQPEAEDHPIDPDDHEKEEYSHVEVVVIDMDPPKRAPVEADESNDE